MSELTKSAIFAALAAVKPNPLTKPVTVKIGSKAIIIEWNNGDEGLPKAAADAMRSAELNFDDPAPGTVDMTVSVDRAIPSMKAIYNRMNRAEYDAAVLALKNT